MIHNNSDVSVLLITLNNEHDIDRVLSSILKSNPGQIIVSDGGSIDNTVNLAKKFTSEVYSGEKGRANQINLGLSKVNKEFILFIEGDHEYEEDFISNLKSEFIQSNYFGLQSTLKCKREENFFEKGISEFYKIHQIEKGEKDMIGGPNIFKYKNYISYLTNLELQGYGVDTALGEIIKKEKLKVGLGNTIAYQYQELDYKTFFRKYFNYGKGDYDFYISHKKEWTFKRKLKSILHIFNRYVVDYPIKSLKVGKPYIAIPYLWLSAIVRYSGWVYCILKGKSY